jgi:hypothetical protein
MFLTISFFRPIQPWFDWTGEEIAENTVAIAPFGVFSYLDMLCDPSFEERADSKCTFLVHLPRHAYCRRFSIEVSVNKTASIEHHHHSISFCSTLSLGSIQISISALDSVTNFRQRL